MKIFMKWLYGATLFLGAFLLFLLEPLFAKRILPWFGGSSSVWTTCLVFFQVTLLLGYLYADLLAQKLGREKQAWVHVLLLLACLPFLPIAPLDFGEARPGLDPVLDLLGLLACSIGLPFGALSATSPLLQSWYSRRHAGEEPYFLFAVSNLASFLALLAFPFLVEPHLDSRAQSLLWSCLFVLFAAGCGFLAWTGRHDTAREPAPSAVPTTGDEKPALPARLLWLSLSACGSMLLLSMTHQICLNVAPIPLLWVLPLALYLLTFTLAFHHPSLYPRKPAPWLLAAALGGLAFLFWHNEWLEKIQVVLPVYLGGLFLTCLFCHGELAALRPGARYLTSYYLMVALGGALGALAVGLAAPALFHGIYEYPLSLVLAALLARWVFWGRGGWARMAWGLGALGLSWAAFYNIGTYEEGSLVMTRNFYAALQVALEGEGADSCRVLYNGAISHGSQFLDPKRALEPTSYYARESGVGLALDFPRLGPKRVGVIGLGAGTLACYGKAGDLFRFYDINPQVPALAENWFSFLKKSPARIEIKLGDARLSLESEPPQGFDVLVVDAFSGDAIPVHLLTREAFALYLRHLKPGGILAFHTTNSYLRLAGVVEKLAREAGYPVCFIENDADDDRLVEFSEWVLVTRNRLFLSEKTVQEAEEPISDIPGLRPWTDDDNNLFQILRPLRAE